MRRIAPAVAGVLLVMALLALYATRGHRWDTVAKIEIGTFSKALSYTPLYVAKHFDWFREHETLRGTPIEYTEFNDRPAISAALTANELQVLFSAEIPAIMCVAQGNDLRIIVISNTARQRVLVRTDSNIRAAEDLRGKRVAVLQGTSSHYGLLKILSAAGLAEADVSLQYMVPTEARAAFESGQLDAWAVWAPFGEQQEVAGTGRELEGEGAWIHSVMSVDTDFLERHEDVARALKDVLERAKKWVQSNPEEAQGIAAQELGLTIEVVRQAWPKFTWDAQLTNDVIEDIQAKAIFLATNEKTRAGRTVDVRTELIPSEFSGVDRP